MIRQEQKYSVKGFNRSKTPLTTDCRRVDQDAAQAGP
jgi:hypothetical protein